VKALPPWLFYDATGAVLFERICDLPEYYPTRTELGILTRHAPALAAARRAQRRAHRVRQRCRHQGAPAAR
jgi:uncharacterized SAM-dependent methyltransferase